LDAAALWTGTITFELVDASSRPAWRLVVMLRRELVTLWRGQHNLAMIDRDRLRAWIATGAGEGPQPLERHDLILTSVRGWIAVAVHVEPPAWITPDDAARLHAVL
jgi:hypothetical protein